MASTSDPQTFELRTLHRSVDELRAAVASVRARYGDVPAVRRLLGDIERIAIDAGELDDLTPPVSGDPIPSRVPLDDRPLDPAMWADADDEGLGGYHR